MGTRSVLCGAHCFFLHPFFVAAGWTKLYGFPLDPRLWAAFFLHDLGYVGKTNMDGPEGELHPYFGANAMSLLFDRRFWSDAGEWYNLCLCHSRYLCKTLGMQPSKLCFADKLATALTPSWLYLPMVTMTGEIEEYLRNGETADASTHWKPTGADKKVLHTQLRNYMRLWVAEHVNGEADTWTNADRNKG